MENTPSQNLQIGKHIRAARGVQGISLSELARRAGISKAYLSQLENAPDKKPSAEIVYRLALALKVAVTDLMGIEPSSPASTAGLSVAAGREPDRQDRPYGAAGESTDPVSVQPTQLPTALRVFWQEHPNLDMEDIRCLAAIRLEGRLPITPNDYWLLYTTIKTATRPHAV